MSDTTTIIEPLIKDREKEQAAPAAVPVRRALILANPKAGALSRETRKADIARWWEKIYNPAARNEDCGDLPLSLPLLAEMAASAGLTADVEPIIPPAEIAKRMTLAQQEGYDTVVVAGGDGTVRSVAQTLVGSSLRLGILPVGTANNFAHALQIPFVLEEALKVVANGSEKQIDVGRIGENYFLESAGVGLFADAFAAVGKEELRPYQLLRILKIVGPLWWNLSARSLKMTLDGVEQQEQAVMIAVSNGMYLGEGMPIAPDARLDDGLFDVVIVGELTRGELPRFAQALFKGTHLQMPQVRVVQAKRVEIRRSDTRLRPMTVHADDRIIAATPITIETLPGVIRILTPKPTNEIHS